jgi:hypothetical protein
MPPEPNRFSRAVAETIIRCFTSAAGNYFAEHSQNPHAKTLTEAVSTFARVMGLSDLLAQAIQVAGENFIDGQARAYQPLPPKSATTWSKVSSAPESPGIKCAGCQERNAFYIPSNDPHISWFCCPTWGCPKAGLRMVFQNHEVV